MSKQIVKAIGGASLAILALAVFAQVRVPAQEHVGNEPTLVGSWDVLVTGRDCQTGTPIPFPPTFPAMMTYHQGGTMQETDLGGPGFVRLPGHGVWERQTGRQYSVAWRFLYFNPDRTLAGTSVIRSALSLSQSGKEYTSTDTLEVLDANGEVVRDPNGEVIRFCATTTAKRFQ